MPAGRIRETEKRGRCLVILNEASAHLVGDLDSHVTGPALGSVEGDDAHRVFVLPFEYFADQRGPISAFLAGLTPRASLTTKILQH
jgi:hypothetical protein